MIVYKCFGLNKEDANIVTMIEHVENITGIFISEHIENQEISGYLFIFMGVESDINILLKEVNNYCKPYHSDEHIIRIFTSESESSYSIIRALINQTDEIPFAPADVFYGFTRIHEVINTLKL